jgi:hypothetical protein
MQVRQGAPLSYRGRMLALYADVCWRMLTYADVCRSDKALRSAIADACSRVDETLRCTLTYADVC